MHPLDVLPNPADMVTWPQALVALAVIFAITVLPQIIALKQGGMIKRKQEELSKGQQKISTSQELMVYEVKSNGGNSLRDVVSRIESKVDKQGRILDEHSAMLADQSEKLEHQTKKLDRHENWADDFVYDVRKKLDRPRYLWGRRNRRERP